MHVAILQTLPAYDEDVKVVQPTPQESVRTNCREAEKQERVGHARETGRVGRVHVLPSCGLQSRTQSQARHTREDTTW